MKVLLFIRYKIVNWLLRRKIRKLGKINEELKKTAEEIKNLSEEQFNLLFKLGYISSEAVRKHMEEKAKIDIEEIRRRIDYIG